MNVLYLPENIASGPAMTAAELNKTKGVNALSLTKTIHKYNTANEYVKYIEGAVARRNPLKWFRHRIKTKAKVKEMIDWADVLHYTWEPFFRDGQDLEWAKKAGKPIFVEWAGSDIRNPDFLSGINPHYKYAYNNGYEYKDVESAHRSEATQKLFAKFGAIPFQSPEMNLYINKAIFPSTISLLQRLNIDNFSVRFPDSNNTKPLIVHSPSALVAKGSNLIIPIIEELKKDYDFDFKLVNGVSRDKALQIMEDADIFIDQIIIGGYGLAATEAMAMGKPVMVYIMPEVFREGLSEDCPIVNTNPDNLKENLIKLITDGQLRHDIGIKSRKFAEKHHDLSIIAQQLIKTYESALDRK